MSFEKKIFTEGPKYLTGGHYGGRGGCPPVYMLKETLSQSKNNYSNKFCFSNLKAIFFKLVVIHQEGFSKPYKVMSVIK